MCIGCTRSITHSSCWSATEAAVAAVTVGGPPSWAAAVRCSQGRWRSFFVDGCRRSQGSESKTRPSYRCEGDQRKSKQTNKKPPRPLIGCLRIPLIFSQLFKGRRMISRVLQPCLSLAEVLYIIPVVINRKLCYQDNTWSGQERWAIAAVYEAFLG